MERDLNPNIKKDPFKPIRLLSVLFDVNIRHLFCDFLFFNCQQCALKNADISDIYFEYLDIPYATLFAIASVNYRLSNEEIWPAQIFDCRAAVRWIRKNAGKYNLNPDKIVAWGASAGGHLSAMLDTSGDVAAAADVAAGTTGDGS